MKIQEVEGNLKNLNSQMANCKALIDKLGGSYKNLDRSNMELGRNLDKIKNGFTNLSSAVKGFTTNFISFDNIVHTFAGGTGMKLIDVTLKYQKTLFDLSQQARVSGRSFSEMKLAIDDIKDSTALSEIEASDFYKTLNSGVRTLTITRQLSVDLAKALSTAYGPALEDINEGTRELIEVQKKLPAVFSDITSKIPTKDYEKYILNMIQLGKISGQEAEAILKTKRAHELGAKALTEEQKKLIELRKVKQEFEKSFQQFTLAVGKPLADIISSFGKAVKPIFEYVADFLNKKDVQQFIGLLMKGAALNIGFKMAKQAFGGLGDMFGGAKGMIGGLQDVNVAKIGGRTPLGDNPLVTRHTGFNIAGQGPGLLGQARNYLGGVAGRAPAAVGGFFASQMAGQYISNQMGGNLGKFAGASVGTTGQGASIGYAVGGPQGALAGAVGGLVAELSTALGNVLEKTFSGGDFEKSNVSFRESVGIFASTSSHWLEETGTITERYDKAVTKVTQERAKEANVRRQGEAKEFNMERIEKKLKEMSDFDKKRLGINPEESLKKQARSLAGMVQEKRTDIEERKGLEKGALMYDIDTPLKQLEIEAKTKAIEEDRIKLADAQKSLRLDTIALDESQLQYQQNLVNLGMQYGDSLDNIQMYADRAVTSIEDQIEKQKELYTLAKESLADRIKEEKEAQKVLDLADKATKPEEELSGLRTDLINKQRQRINVEQQLRDIQKDMVSKEQQRLDLVFKITQARGAEIQASQSILDYESLFGKNMDKTNKLIEKNVVAYAKEQMMLQEQVDTRKASIEELEKQPGTESQVQNLAEQINRIEAKIATSRKEQNMQLDHAVKWLEQRKNVVDSTISLEEANLQLNTAINGGLGATLEIRSRIYDSISKGIGLVDEEIAKERLRYKTLKESNQDTILAEKNLADLTLKRTQYINKQVELTKSLRDGYLSALQTFQQVEGTFSKTIMTRESGLGEAMRKGMAAQGFSAGALGAGMQQSVYRRNPDGSITIPTAKLLQNTWRNYEKQYDPNRPQIRGIESVAAGVLQERGLVSHYTAGEFGPMSEMYGKQGDLESLELPEKIKKNLVAPSPEDVGKNIEKTGATMKTAFEEASTPIVDGLEDIRDVLVESFNVTKQIGDHTDPTKTKPTGVPSAPTAGEAGQAVPTPVAGTAGGGLTTAEKETVPVFEFKKLTRRLEQGRISREEFEKLYQFFSDFSSDKRVAEYKAKNEQKIFEKMTAFFEDSKKEKTKGPEKTTNEQIAKKAVEETKAKEEKEPYSKRHRELIQKESERMTEIGDKFQKNVENLGSTLNTRGTRGKFGGYKVDQEKVKAYQEEERKRDEEIRKARAISQKEQDDLAKSYGMKVERREETTERPEKEDKKVKETVSRWQQFTEREVQSFKDQAESDLKNKYAIGPASGKDYRISEKKGAAEAAQAEKDLMNKYALVGGQSKAEEQEKDRVQNEQLEVQKKSGETLAAIQNNTGQAVEADRMGQGDLGVPVAYAQSGGWVGGSGSGDKIPAMLEPGEFVVNKKAAGSFAGLLTSINAKRYAEGGPVGGLAAASASIGAPKINFNIRGDSAKKILEEANKGLSSVLSEMMEGTNASARYYNT